MLSFAAMSPELARYTLRDIVVVPAGATSPYTTLVIGGTREDALRRFRDGLNTPEFEFWYAPLIGRPKRLTAADVDWQTI